MKQTRIDWTNKGREHNYTRTEEQRAELLSEVSRLDNQTPNPDRQMGWMAIPQDGSALNVGMMPGEAIKTAIRELRIPRVSHIAIGGCFRTYGFYGIRGHYKGNLTVEVFLVDCGVEITVVFCRVHEPASVEKVEVAA